MSALRFSTLIDRATRFLFFTGKGGVGKTSTACATAVALADAGKRVLLVSTDPASNLDEVLMQDLGRTPTVIPGVKGLFALNIEPEEAARVYREQLVGPFKGKLPEAVTRRMEEELSGACTLEIAAFDEFSTLLADEAATAKFDHLIFDTAPTGHTLRLLTLPSAWTGFLDTNSTGASCLGPLAGLQKKKELYQKTVKALSDPALTTVVLVTRAQVADLKEAGRTKDELAALGISNQKVILNGRFHSSSSIDPIAHALSQREEDAIRSTPGLLEESEFIEIPLYPSSVLGVQALRDFIKPHNGEFLHPTFQSSPVSTQEKTLDDFVETLRINGHGLVMTMGKGGVGKTTIAAAIAYKLASGGAKVHLSTTDPAAHIASVAAGVSGLEISRIDPIEETRKYVDHVLSTSGSQLNAQAKALLEEDLRSPCTEEIAVFRAFAKIVAGGKEGFVVLDTAPTGHTLLLLDASEAYHRELARKSIGASEEVMSLLPRLRDPNFTHVFLVTLPEATPVHEAAALQHDLERAGIQVEGWIINQSFAASGTDHPVLKQKAINEGRFIREVTEQYASKTAIIPWLPVEPVGQAGLSQLFFKPTFNFVIL